MSPAKRYAKTQAKARMRRRRNAQERQRHEQAQAQRAIEALYQTLQELGFPEELIREIEGRLRAQKKLMAKIFAMMFPTLFGCRSYVELCRVRGWDKNLPGRILGGLPRRSWLKRLRHLGLGVVEAIWRYAQDKSPATRSRWQLTWVIDDSVCKKYGQQLDLVGTWWSGQEKHVRPGIDGVLLLVVIGDGKLVVPIDFVIRRPNPKGPGRRCYNKLIWTQVMLDECVAALERRGLRLPPVVLVADSWLSDSKLMTYVQQYHQGTLLVEGKSIYVCILPDGRRLKGHDLTDRNAPWKWQCSPWEAGVKYVRLRATSPTYGKVTVVIVDEPKQDRYYLICLETSMNAPQLLRRWHRRHWIAFCFRILKHLLGTETCQVPSEDAYYGHLVLRLMGAFMLFCTSRRVLKGKLTMEEMICSVKHYWRFVDCEALELQALSQGPEEDVA
jgi:hypothetical protein